ncbi:ribosomal maturation YjgA family protein [Microbacterium aoyamense]|uniref:ribosomal maturation YjgA family protein n=1 Tax=Microbacterium aoyamense TaxID=344166 RepID=UPI0020049ABB|nr:DUF2809 domain-containing protein [Microbacterium aoyamense]
MSRRVAAAIALASVIVAGLAVHAFLPDTSATDIAGDALYAVAAYSGIVLLAPRLKPWVVALIAGAWCVAVELFQLTGIPLALGGLLPPVMLLLGTVFDARDLVIYIAAVVTAGLIDAAVRRPGKLDE